MSATEEDIAYAARRLEETWSRPWLSDEQIETVHELLRPAILKTIEDRGRSR